MFLKHINVLNGRKVEKKKKQNSFVKLETNKYKMYETCKSQIRLL